MTATTQYEVRCPRGHFLALISVNLPLMAGKPTGAGRGYCKTCASKFDLTVLPKRVAYVDICESDNAR